MADPTDATPETTPPRNGRPLVARWWFWLAAAVVVVAVIVAIGLFSTKGSSGLADPASASPAGRGASGSDGATSGGAGASSSAPTTAGGSAPQDTVAQDTAAVTDDGWTLADVHAEVSQTGTSFTAQITNDEDAPRPGQWTLTVLSGGQRIYETEAAVDEVGEGETVAVTFVGTTTQLPGDPTTYTYALRSDG
jgi:hypothetical protein